MIPGEVQRSTGSPQRQFAVEPVPLGAVKPNGVIET